MATLSERLDRAITAQQAEIARIRDDRQKELDAARAVLNSLQAARQALTPAVEAIAQQALDALKDRKD